MKDSIPQKEDTNHSKFWSFKNIKWADFAKKCEELMDESKNFESPQECYTYFIKCLTDTIIKTTPFNRK